MSGWLDGLAHEHGANWNYQHGRNRMEACVAHRTYGACGGDRAVMLRGYFNLYVPKSQACAPGATQAAPVDALCFGACEWNSRVTHIEVEGRNEEPFTDYQVDVLGRLVVPQLVAAGIAFAYTHGPPRLEVGAPVSGFVAHDHLHEHKCDEHGDAWTDADWARVAAVAGPIISPPTPGGNMARLVKADGDDAVFVQDGATKVWVAGESLALVQKDLADHTIHVEARPAIAGLRTVGPTPPGW